MGKAAEPVFGDNLQNQINLRHNTGVATFVYAVDYHPKPIFMDDFFDNLKLKPSSFIVLHVVTANQGYITPCLSAMLNGQGKKTQSLY